VKSKEMFNSNFFSYLPRNLSSFFRSLINKNQRKFLAFTTPRKRRDRYAKSLGFTLLEVLVVMVMVGILSAIAAPSWLGFVNNQRINASQTKIFQAIKVAQSDSKIRSSNNSNRVQITFTTGQTDNAYRTDNVRTGAGLQSLEPGVRIASVTSGGSITPVVPPIILASPYTIQFDSRGLVFDPGNQLNYPICINLSVENSPSIRWIAIRTLIGAIVTGSGGSCINPV
jgi:prepilin-type N-terminal cleavage/methylation domain-containing protein